jgi:hypothetical protein
MPRQCPGSALAVPWQCSAPPLCCDFELQVEEVRGGAKGGACTPRLALDIDRRIIVVLYMMHHMTH